MDSSATKLAKGTIVEIFGLASEKGKALNGGYGLISKDPSMVSSTLRYPVLVYALLVPSAESKGDDNKEGGGSSGDGDDDDDGYHHEVIKSKKAEPKALKADNIRILEDQKQPLFRDAIMAQLYLAQESNDHPGAFVWYEAFYNRWPDDKEVGIVLTYLQLVQIYKKNPKRALEIITPIKERANSDTFPRYNEFLKMYVGVCVDAGERIDEALDCALEIDTDTQENKDTCFSALCDVLSYTSKKNEEDVIMGNPEMFDIQLRTAKRLYELQPDNIQNLINFGAAHCLNGNNVEGAKCYRRALASGEVTDHLEYLKSNLISAQLQCPGMPLEDYIMVFDDRKVANCIKKSDKHHCQIIRERTGYGTQNGRIVVNGESVDMIAFPLPSDPDDPDVFPSSFLETLV